MGKIVNIFKPFTTSTIVGVDKYLGTSIAMSCGGGMGGNKWCEYTTDNIGVKELNEKFIKTDTNMGRNQILNTTNVVKVAPIAIVKLEVKNDGNEYCPNGISTYYFEVEQDDMISVQHKYGENPKTVIPWNTRT